MSLVEDIRSHTIGNIIFPFSNYLANRRMILRNYNKFIESEWKPQETLQHLQLDKLRKIVNYAYTYIPYYNRKFKEIGLLPGDIKCFKDIHLIPPLNRQDVIDYREEMVDYRFKDSVAVADKSLRGPASPIPFARFRKHKLVRNRSSGSTGAPTIFYEDGSTTSLNWAHELRLKHWYGINPGAKEARMTRISAEYMPKHSAILLRKLFWNQLILPGMYLSERDYEYCYNRIIEFQPMVLWGITSALAGLAEYIRDTKQVESIQVHPNLIFTWAAPLYEHEKKILGTVFKCPVTNIYGAREVGHIAALCPGGSLHINQESLYVETQRDDDPNTDAEVGELLVTTLETLPMPFIRYRMGDLGNVVESSCSCGRSLKVLTDFLGRTGEVFITKDGRMISPNFWCRTFMDEELAFKIKRFQVVYKKNGDIFIRIVKNESYSQKTEDLLRQKMDKNFYSNKVEIAYASKIEPQISGKYQMVVKES